MLARDEEQIAKALFLEGPGFAADVVHAQGDTQDRVITREAAVGTIVGALVRQIERRKEPDDFAEALPGQRLRMLTQGLEQLTRGWRNQRREIRQRKR